MAQAQSQIKLCPHCANTIPVEVEKCPYCKAALAAEPVYQWPAETDEVTTEPQPKLKEGIPLGSKIILVLGLSVFALGVYLVGGHRERSDFTPAFEEKQKELAERDDKLKSMEKELALSRTETKQYKDQVDELQGKLEALEKKHQAAQQRTADSQKVAERLGSRPAPLPPPAVRPRDAALPQPQVSAPTPLPPLPARRAVEPGLYETVRSTAVHEEPLGGAKVVARISGGTQITVVRGVGEWLEVRSKHGNPPGFVRADDVMFVSKAN